MSPSRPSLRKTLLVRPGHRIDLSKVDPADTHGYTKDAAIAEIERGLVRLDSLQERIWA